MNFGKADWENFRSFTEYKFRKVLLPLDVFSSDKLFVSVMKKAAKRFIPAGRIPKIRPNFPSSGAMLADERDELRQQGPSILGIYINE